MAARWLGGVGAIPFVALAAASLFLDETLRDRALFALTVYGAVILSFLGGVRWGLAIANYGPLSFRRFSARLMQSVVPSLVGWVAVLLPRQLGLSLLALAFVMIYVLDLFAARRREAPAWYPALRLPLTVAVTLSLAPVAVDLA